MSRSVITDESAESTDVEPEAVDVLESPDALQAGVAGNYFGWLSRSLSARAS